MCQILKLFSGAISRLRTAEDVVMHDRVAYGKSLPLGRCFGLPRVFASGVPVQEGFPGFLCFHRANDDGGSLDFVRGILKAQWKLYVRLVILEDLDQGDLDF